MPMLRPLELADTDALLRLYTEPDTRAFLGGSLSADEAREKVDDLLVGQRRYPVWAIRLAGDDRSDCLGLVSLDPHHDGRDVEISYLLLPEHRGRGHATQAVAEAIKHATEILNLNRVVAETRSDNLRAVRLLDRVGMKFQRRVVRFGAEQSIYATLPRGRKLGQAIVVAVLRWLGSQTPT